MHYIDFIRKLSFVTFIMNVDYEIEIDHEVFFKKIIGNY